MPIYDYVCSRCSTRTEFIHAIDAPAPKFCPACGAEDTLRKAFVPPAVVFKGSGWAKKDRSGSGGSKTRAAAASSEGKPASGDAGTSTGGASDGGTASSSTSKGSSGRSGSGGSSSEA